MKNILTGILILCAVSPATAADLTFSAIRLNGVLIPASRVQTDLGGRQHLSQMLHGSPPTGTSEPKKVEQVVDRIIVRELLVQEARRRGLNATDAEVAGAWEAERSRWGSDEKLQKSLEVRGLTADYLRERIAEDLLLRKLVRELHAGVTVTEQDERSHYEENPSIFPVPGPPQLRCIYIDSSKHGGQQGVIQRYQEFLTRLGKGETFAGLVEEFSDHPSASTGGVIEEHLALPFIERARELVPGQFTNPPGEDASGLYCYYRDRRPQALSFEQARDKVRASLLERRRKEQVDSLVRDLRTTARIEFVPK